MKEKYIKDMFCICTHSPFNTVAYYCISNQHHHAFKKKGFPWSLVVKGYKIKGNKSLSHSSLYFIDPRWGNSVIIVIIWGLHIGLFLCQ